MSSRAKQSERVHEGALVNEEKKCIDQPSQPTTEQTIVGYRVKKSRAEQTGAKKIFIGSTSSMTVCIPEYR